MKCIRDRFFQIIFLGVLTLTSAQAAEREAELRFENRKGQKEIWALKESRVSNDDGTLSIVREFVDEDILIFRERSTFRDGQLQKVEIEDVSSLQSGEIIVRGETVVYRSMEGEKTEKISEPLMTMSGLGFYIISALEKDSKIKEILFRVPIMKAKKSVPMKLIMKREDSGFIKARLESRDLLITLFYMRKDFEFTVNPNGEIVEYKGQIEPYDHSSGRPKSIFLEYRFS